MIYLLDTNACINYMNVRDSAVARKLATLQPADVVVCSVVKAELFYGARRTNNPTRTLAVQRQFLSLFVSLPFDDTAAEVYGNIRAKRSHFGYSYWTLRPSDCCDRSS